MNRASVTTKTQEIEPSTAAERAVYRHATVGPDGATVALALQLEPALLRLPSSRHAAALEDLARVIRTELLEQEQLAIQHGAGGPATPKPQAHQEQRGGVR